MTDGKILIHSAGTPLGGVQFCSRCGATLWVMSSANDDAIPVDAKVSIEDGLPKMHYGEIDRQTYVVCVPKQKEVHGTQPA